MAVVIIDFGWDDEFDFAEWAYSDAVNDVVVELRFMLERGVDPGFAIRTLDAIPDGMWSQPNRDGSGGGVKGIIPAAQALLSNSRPLYFPHVESRVIGRVFALPVRLAHFFWRAAISGHLVLVGKQAIAQETSMDDLLLEYLPIIIFLGVAIGLAVVIIGASWLAARQKPDSIKLSAYECGFDTFSDSRNQFDVRFYLVALLFIIFDLEVAFLFPWAISLGAIGLFGFWSMVLFLGILTVGFVYEWRKGALEWE